MKKPVVSVTDIFLGSVIIAFLVMLFYLTQKNYVLLIKSNEAVVRTSNLIGAHQKVSNDFKNAVIYISTYKNSPTQAYVHTYGRGLWEVSLDMIRLKRLVGPAEKEKLAELSKQIYMEEDWLTTTNINDPLLADERDRHISNIIAIQSFFDNEITRLEHQSITDLKASEFSLGRLHHWIIALIISTSAVVLLTILLISKQLRRVKMQNSKLMEIAWMQSHKVRAHVANLLGLGQLFDIEHPNEADNKKIVSNIVATSKKLDGIVREISEKSSVN
ncbi:MAG TPA: hypothetical protein VL490_10885 [Mucilaginibacter sp.]|jgi:hypothetical protein|nr:hypothetical protein [Mucilaginibacter sp.]